MNLPLQEKTPLWVHNRSIPCKTLLVVCRWGRGVALCLPHFGCRILYKQNVRLGGPLGNHLIRQSKQLCSSLRIQYRGRALQNNIMAKTPILHSTTFLYPLINFSLGKVLKMPMLLRWHGKLLMT